VAFYLLNSEESQEMIQLVDRNPDNLLVKSVPGVLAREINGTNQKKIKFYGKGKNNIYSCY
jgi:hypothetical protein